MIMKRKLVFVSFLIFSSILFVLYTISTTAAPEPPITQQGIDKDKESIEVAVLEAVRGEREFVIGYLVNDVQVADVQLSEDGTWGIAFLEMVDPKTGEVLPSEPGLAITLRQGDEWQVILPADPQWLELVKSAPQDLLTDEYKLFYEDVHTAALASMQATIGGYLLPWEAGKSVSLSQSTGHDRYIPSGSAHYSFDFYISKTMYRLHASRSGTVWRNRWDVPNGDDSDMGNYIVLKDTSTIPTTYQLYLHLAQDSIPPELRSEGAYVAQGQFIGIADDTGQSTGHHLHFHVHTNPNSYWGTSVDITFDDVDINGGRPRRESDLPYCTRPGDVCNKFRNTYISGNTVHGDSTPPIGDLFEPSTGGTISSPTVHVEGWASDEDSGFARARLLAYFNYTWHEVGNEITTTVFALDWDVCADDVPDGPVSIAIRAWDHAGNPTIGLPGLTHLIKDYSCEPPPPACTPGEDQVALFSDTDYLENCKILGLGEYLDSTHFSPVGDNNVESILIGGNVKAALYSNPNFNGRSETLIGNDSNMDDNSIGGNTLSSLKVINRSEKPPAPTELLVPVSGGIFTAGDSISFAWRDPGGGTQFQVYLDGPSGEVNSPWLASTFWHLGGQSLQEGSYSWKVRARNCPDSSCNSPWSPLSSFDITSSPPSLLAAAAPFADNMETGTGNWNDTERWSLIDDVDRSNSASHSWYYGRIPDRNYDTGVPNSGDLTLRPIMIPDTGYVLTFWYRYDTEGPGDKWDQRWIQISTDGGPFVNALQLHDDVGNYWLKKTLDLSGYAGQTIQIRFHFATLDHLFNDFEGWYIDDIDISQATLPTCTDTDNTPAEARTITLNQKLSGKMCPTGDVDYYKFEGVARDHIVLDIDTPTGSPVDGLDLILFLVDGDGTSILATHDDEIYGYKTDPHLGYELTRSGTYYVRTRLWSHPSAGGEEFSYDITLTKDNNKPQGEIISPLSGTYLNDPNQVSISVNASDSDSGISHVQFLYHSGDWLTTNWQVIGTDQDGTDGWNFDFDVTSIPDQNEIAFFTYTYDWAGNWVGSGSWDIVLDRTPPVSALSSLEASQESTAVQLNWSGSDNLSGVDHYELQTQIGSGSWTDVDPDPGGSEETAWFVGQSGKEYGFRIGGVDVAGNQEAFPSSADTRTSIPNALTLCSSPDDWDNGSNDNSPSNAPAINLNELPKSHNFCNPLTGDRLNDEDWVKFNIEIGENYIFQSTPLVNMTASILELYQSDGTTMITAIQPEEFGESSRIIWTADRDGLVYLRSRHLDGKVAGNIVSYLLTVSKYHPMFFPLINR